jgi:hypothetical protein
MILFLISGQNKGVKDENKGMPRSGKISEI